MWNLVNASVVSNQNSLLALTPEEKSNQDWWSEGKEGTGSMNANRLGIGMVVLMVCNAWAQERPRFLKTPPAGVIEVTGFGTDGGIVELREGSLLLAQGGGILDQSAKKPMFRISKDGGTSWTAPLDLNAEIGVGGLIRLKSGDLAIFGRKNGHDIKGAHYYFSKSADEGKTWSPAALVSTYPGFYPVHHSLIQLESGRLLLSGYWEDLNGNHPDLERHTRTGWGFWRGKILFMEGHRGVEMGICMTFYSDDEGQTWKRSEGGIFGWFDRFGETNGADGIVDLYEPASAETSDGRVLMFARSKTGRLVQSYSRDGGKTWYSAQPTELSSSQSPALLIRVPKTGDLLCVWNQVSGEEVRRGFLRGRLSVAISKDSGLTWKNFKTLELQEGMEDVSQIAPEFPIVRRLVARSGIGQLPDGYAMFTYPNVDIVGDKVFIRYSRMWPILKAGVKSNRDPSLPVMWPTYEEREVEMNGEGVLRICPLEWFYK